MPFLPAKKKQFIPITFIIIHHPIPLILYLSTTLGAFEQDS